MPFLPDHPEGTVVTVGIDVRTPGADVPAVDMTERFAIRGRTGSAELADPQPAGGAVNAAPDQAQPDSRIHGPAPAMRASRT